MHRVRPRRCRRLLRLCGTGQGAAVGVGARGDGGAELDLGDQAAGRRDPPQGGEQGVVADERGRGGGRSAGEPVADPDRLDRHPGVQGGLEDGPAKGALGPAAPGAALGERRDGGALAQGPGDTGDGVREGPQPVPVDEQGAAAGGQRPGDGPPPYLGLGQHPRGANGGEQRDVQPGDMVGDQQQSAGGGGGAGDADPDPRGPHEPPAPPPDQGCRYPGTERRQRDPREQQQDYPGEPQHGTRHGPRRHPRRHPHRRLHTGLRRAGRGGQPGAHQAGTRDRKCRR
ncbi:hypothetical protein SAFG77S_08125 [Streptomyces afghaniensis]